MKTKILDALKTKFTGVQDAILDRIATKMAKTVTTEEEVTTAVEGVTLQSVIDSYADNRSTEAAKTAVTNYETKHSIKDGKPEKVETKPVDKTKDDDETPAWAKNIIESNKTLSEKLLALEGEKMEQKRLTALNKVIENAPDTLKARFGKDFSRMNFQSDDDYTSWLEGVKTDVDTIVTDMTAAGAVIKKPVGGGGGKAPEKPNEAVLERIKEREASEPEASPIQGLPKK